MSKKKSMSSSRKKHVVLTEDQKGLLRHKLLIGVPKTAIAQFFNISLQSVYYQGSYHLKNKKE